MSVQVEPATADRWDDLVRVFGRRGDDASWDWCQLFLRPNARSSAQADASPDNRSALRRQVIHAAVPPGLIAFVDGRPVGWTRVGPRQAFPGVVGNRAMASAAVRFARDHGATAVEGHPVDVAGLTASRVSGSAIYTGTMTMFAAAGFVEVGRTSPTRPVMRLAF